jgi:MFS transporter, AAHS family, benzoate transport protein
MPLDIERVIDGARLGPLHWRVLTLCALVTLLDGFDIQAMASATPTLVALLRGAVTRSRAMAPAA